MPSTGGVAPLGGNSGVGGGNGGVVAPGGAPGSGGGTSSGGVPAIGGDHAGGAPAEGGTIGTGGASAGSGGGVQAGGTGGTATGGTGAGTFRVIGYFPSWAGAPSDIAFEQLTHVNYAFALPNADGSLQAVENESKLDDLVSRAHASGVKVLISIGGWNDGDDRAFHALASSSAGRTRFADAVSAYVEAHALDGADIDWEYPENESEYAPLITELSSRLRAEGKLLTAAVTGSSWGSGGITAAVYPLMDFLNLMAYDGGDGAEHSPYSYAVSALEFWSGKGLPREKMVLGVPFYARPSWRAYSALVAEDPAAANQDQLGTDFYNGIPTIQAKTELAIDRGSGVMIWELTQDTHDSTSLLVAIDGVVREHGLR